MFPFIALLWNADQNQQQATAEAAGSLILAKHPLWTSHLAVPGLAVYAPVGRRPEGEVIVLPERAGVLIGVAFSRSRSNDASPHHEIRAFSRESVRALRASSGRHAIDTLWGAYVLIITGTNHHERYVLRGPASLLACFHAQIRGIHTFFSVVDDCIPLSPRPFTINWAVLRAQAVEGAYLTRETGLNEVTAIEGGECVCHTTSALTHKLYWTPCAISKERPFRRFSETVSALRRETLGVIHSWASRHTAILLQLSGGVDSSIVLACLALAPTAPRVIAAHLYSSRVPIDERAFARSMAAKTRTPLFEIKQDSPWDLSIFSKCARTARPVLDHTAPGRLPVIAELARTNGADAVFDGELGDNVFGHQYGGEPVVEYLQRHGPHPGILRVARDAARSRRCSIWRILMEAKALGLFRSSSRSYLTFLQKSELTGDDSIRLVTREVLRAYYEEAERFVHPWFESQVAPCPSSVQLIHALIVTTSTAYECPFSLPDQPAYPFPLISQPLIETALRVPGRFSVYGGWNRAAIRAAFSAELSNEVRFRSSKTNTTPWVRLAIRANLPWLREFLLDGILARERILDRDRMDTVLSMALNNSEVLINHVFVQLYIEGWLRQWVR